MCECLILGFFDGVHIAHKSVINSALSFARGENVKLITFKDTPALYFGGNAEYIMQRNDSIKKIKSLGVGAVVQLDFPSIAKMTAEEYLEFISKKYSPNAIFTGFNHTFGLNKQGNPDFLRQNQEKYDYKYFCIQPIKTENNTIISSTVIRNMLKNGKISDANKLLDSNFSLEGKVIHGAEIGRKIGFPTANIKYPDKLVKIPFGVYRAQVIINNITKDAVINWGIKPTVNNTEEPIVEAHLLNFDDNLYEKNIRIEILYKIRSEKTFKNLEELKQQIERDIKACSEL